MHNIKHDTIAAIATPIGEGGIGIVRISGPKALGIADNVFISKKGTKPSSVKTFTVHYGYITVKNLKLKVRSAPENTVIDEVLLTVMRAPHSYTKEDIVEISCHGGVVAVKRVLEVVLGEGARMAEAGEFTKRAFLNGRIDLAEAESVADIINARTEAALKTAVSNLEGALSCEIKAAREKLIGLLGDIEVAIDFSEEDIDTMSLDEMKNTVLESSTLLKNMLDNALGGMLIKEGVACVIAGKPNVGKSSLLNALLRRNRAIVTHVPGTTRDTIEELMNIGNVPVKLIDTAGIVETKDIVERKGIQKTKSCIKAADIVILLLDLSRPFDKKDKDVMKLIPEDKMILVGNKCDLKEKLGIGKDTIRISILKKKNIELVEKAIEDRIWQGKVIHPEAAFVSTIRQKKAIQAALGALKDALKALNENPKPELLAVDIRNAIFELGLITGETVDLDILDRIFANFCIGK